MASLQQSDLRSDPLPRHRCRQNTIRNVRCKRARTPDPTGLASDASLNAAERSPPSERLRQAKNPSGTTYHDPEKDFVCSSELSNQDVVTTQSEEIPIRGFLTLKTFESKVIFCLSFSQELLLQSGGTCASKSSVRSATLQSKSKRVLWKPEENKTICKMKKKGCLWKEIYRAFPDRTLGAIQVQYSTKLKK